MGKVLKKFGYFICFLTMMAIIGGVVYVFAINPDVLKPEYTVTFEIDSSEIDNNSTLKVKDGSIIELPTPQDREGYTFDGWYNGNKKWTKEDKITSNLKLKPKWIAKLYNITFIIDGQSQVIPCRYDEMAQYTGETPTKQPVQNTMYTFIGWEPELAIVKGEATYTAKFKENSRIVNINVSSNYANAGNFSYDKQVNYDGSVTISASENKGYEFAGWYNNNLPFTENYLNKTITIQNVQQDLNLTAEFNLINYTINYFNFGGSNDNITTYNAEMGTVTLKDISKAGYVFHGWYTQQDGKGIKVESIDINNVDSFDALYAYFTNEIKVSFYVEGKLIDSFTQTTTIGSQISPLYVDGDLFNNAGHYIDTWYLTSDCLGQAFDFTTAVTSNLTLYSKWSKKEYNITFIVNSTPVVVTCEYGELPVYPNPEPTKPSSNGINYSFDGWEPALTITTKNATYNAKFVESYKIQFSVEGVILENNSITVKSNGLITRPTISYNDYGMSCYSVETWYEDSAYTKVYNFSTPVTKPVTLYGKWEYILDNGFYDYLTKFNTALTTKMVDISCEADLISWVEFVQFYEVTEKIEINFTSSYNVKGASSNELSSKVSAILDKSDYPNGQTFRYSYNNTYVLTSIFTKEVENFSTKEADPTNEQVNTQYEGLITVNSKRNSSFDNFNINKVNQTISVKTSNQLVYALQKGLRPIPVKNSSAEIVYNEAKSVLRKICNDDMSDFEKIRAIYEWLVLNVQYDHKAASSSEVINNWQQYTAWYPEGVFVQHKAVCDGIAKSMLILARIENIACTRVHGIVIMNSVGHAWNKVYINNNWYGIDATHGDVGVSSYEILSYTSFLFTDSYKQETTQFDIDERTKTPTSPLNVYEMISFGEGSEAFDLYINSMEELNNLNAYIQKYTQNLSYYQGNTNHNKFTIEVALDSNSGITKAKLCSTFKVYSYVPLNADGNISTYGFVISF